MGKKSFVDFGRSKHKEGEAFDFISGNPFKPIFSDLMDTYEKEMFSLGYNSAIKTFAEIEEEKLQKLYPNYPKKRKAYLKKLLKLHETDIKIT